jgi:hypothetical protein
MNYAEMSLIELKQIAKSRRYIKKYYVLSKQELVAILSLPEPPLEMKLAKMTIRSLREEATRRGLHGFWSMTRAQLLQLLYPGGQDKTAPNKNEQNESHTNEHNDPECHDSQ